MAECPVEGWALYAQSQQQSRRRMYEIEGILGRRLSATPTHLSRALYVPRHQDDDVSHLPLYDISKRYKDAIGETPVGSSMYTVKLGTMARPRGDGTDEVDVGYLVDFEKNAATGDCMARVQRRGPVRPGEDDGEIQLEIPLSTNAERGGGGEVAGTLKFKEPFGTDDKALVPISISYPITASETRLGTIAHPYFTFEVPMIFGSTVFQWQIHPKENGPLRYTLVAIPSSGPSTTLAPEENHQDGQQQRTEREPEIGAIYHHIGLGISLSQSYSEGVLLLPDSTGSEAEGIIVASLLAVLRQLRGMDGGKGNSKKGINASGNKGKSQGIGGDKDGKTGLGGKTETNAKKRASLSFLGRLKGKK